jgi:VanZ family protein
MEVLAGMLPPAAAPTEGPWDKPVHAAGYLCLLVLAVSAYGRGSNRLLWSAILLAAAAHGGAAELAQWMLNTRQADWFDWFADLAGIAAGALLISAVRRLGETSRSLPRSSESPEQLR